MDRKAQYEEYLNSPAAKVERILDEMDEERLKLEQRESIKSMRKTWKKLAKSLMTAIAIILMVVSLSSAGGQKKTELKQALDKFIASTRAEDMGTYRVLKIRGIEAKKIQDSLTKQTGVRSQVYIFESTKIIFLLATEETES